jgi:hypothetical protein
MASRKKKRVSPTAAMAKAIAAELVGLGRSVEASKSTTAAGFSNVWSALNLLREVVQQSLEKPVGVIVGVSVISPAHSMQPTDAPQLCFGVATVGETVQVIYERPDGTKRHERIEFHRPVLLVVFGNRIVAALTSGNLDELRERILGASHKGHEARLATLEHELATLKSTFGGA